MDASYRAPALLVADDLTDLGDAADEARAGGSEIIAFDDWRQACYWLDEDTPATAFIGPMNHHASRHLLGILRDRGVLIRLGKPKPYEPRRP